MEKIVLKPVFKSNCLACALLLCTTVAHSEIVTDNTLNGNQVRLNSTQMTIDQTLGKVTGQNLFHSFKVFNINKNQTAIFTDTGNHAIQNIISRVTGKGAVSYINGTLAVDSTMPNANFYFINPNGVMFGKGSYVNVPAAFHVSTADHVKFNNSGVFSATLPDTASSFTATEPESFGFLGGKYQKQAVLSIQGSTADSDQWTQWSFNEGQKVSFTAGQILLEGALDGKNDALNDEEVTLPIKIEAKGGEIRLQAIGDAKTQVPIHDRLNANNLRNLNYNGSLQIKGANISTANGNSSGLIVAQAGDMVIGNNSKLISWHKSTQKAPLQTGIFIGTTHNLKIIENGKIEASNQGNSQGGQVVIKSKDLSISGKGSGIFNNAACDHGLCKNTDSAGATTIHVDGTLKVSNAGVIRNNSYSAFNGNGGAINITARHIVVDGFNQSQATGLFSDQCPNGISACSDASGKAGDIKLTAQTVNIINGGNVSSSTKNQGAAGNVTVTANNLMLQNATITTKVNNPQTKANGGSINLRSEIIRLNNSQVTTSVNGNGTGGNITISGKNGTLTKGLILNGGFIQANGNKGGAITNKVATLLTSHGQLQVGGTKRAFQSGFNVIQAASKKGEGGTIKSTAPQLNITGAMLNLKSGFLQKSELNASPCTVSKGSSLVQAGYGGLPRKSSDAVYIPNITSTHKPLPEASTTTFGKPKLSCKPNNEKSINVYRKHAAR